MEKARTEEDTEEPGTTTDQENLPQVFDVDPDSLFSVNDQTVVVSNNCGIIVGPAVKHFVDVGTETEPIVESIVKQFVDVGTQTTPSDCPVVETILTPEERRRIVALDHTYSKSKLEFSPKNASTKAEPEVVPLKGNAELSDLSDDEWCDDVDDAVSDCGSDASDEDWQPDADDEDSDDENAEYLQVSSSNWLEENKELTNESKSIVFDSCLKQLFQICWKCGDAVKKAHLKQRGSLNCVTTVCKAGHTEPWFSQLFTKGTATGNLIFAGGILFTGNHFLGTNGLMSACNIRFFKKGNFNLIQTSTFAQ